MILVTSWSILVRFEGFGKIKKCKMADPRWPLFESMTLLGRHMTSSADVADLKGNYFHVLTLL